MITFVIIGRNEGWKLSKCLSSVFETIKKNKIINFEVIYVDSNSTDDSIHRAKSFDDVRIYKITGVCNAAIARNIGAKESSGDVLFFIDGDMEIQADFLPLVYSEAKGLVHPFCSGNWINYNYSDFENRTLVSKKIKKELKNDVFEFTTGGLFLIERTAWEKVGGMKNKLRRSQDWDLALRLAKEGILMLRKKEILAIHHTIPPLDNHKEMRSLVFSGAKFFRMVILRDNLFNKYQWKQFIRVNYTLVFLIFCLGLSLMCNTANPLLLYLFLIIFRCIVRKQYTPKILISNVFLFVFYEFVSIFIFFFYWPANHEEVYTAIKK